MNAKLDVCSGDKRPARCVALLTLCSMLLAFVAPCAAQNKSRGGKKRGKKGEQAAQQIAPEVVDITPPAPAPIAPANGSLYSPEAQNASLLSDFKARGVGDLVFVDVVEASDASVTSRANRSRDSGTLGGIGTLAGALPLPGAAVAGTIAGALGTRKFEGRGSTSRQSNLNSRIVARVVDRLPNGDLVVVAEKLVRINKETETLKLTGILRTRDVTANNVVPTTAIGDLRVELNGKGVASADNAPGWLFRFFERVTPF